jgi:hypothetical protein
MLPKLAQIADSVVQSFTVLLDWFEEANVYLHDHFGLTGQVTFNLGLIAFLFLAVFKISKVVFNLLLWVVIPSLALSFIASCVLPYTFFMVLPFCAGFFIAVNIVKS